MARFRGGSTNGVGFPSYIDEVSVVTKTYAAPYDGWLVGYVVIPDIYQSDIYINEILVSQEYGDYAVIQMPLAKGDVFTSNASSIVLKFLKFKGI